MWTFETSNEVSRSRTLHNGGGRSYKADRCVDMDILKGRLCFIDTDWGSEGEVSINARNDSEVTGGKVGWGP